MGGDRYLQQIVEAHTCGAIDFSIFDPRDKRHWQRLRWILQQLAREDRKAIYTRRHAHWCALLANKHSSLEQIREYHENAQDYLNKFIEVIYPSKTAAAVDKKTDGERTAEGYHKIFGHPGDESYEQMRTRLREYLAKPKPTKSERKRYREAWRKRNIKA